MKQQRPPEYAQFCDQLHDFIKQVEEADDDHHALTMADARRFYDWLRSQFGKRRGIPQKAARAEFVALGDEDTKVFVKQLLSGTPVPQEFRGDMLIYLCRLVRPQSGKLGRSAAAGLSDGGGDSNHWLRSTQVLLTWNGEFGRVPYDGPKRPDIDSLVEELKRQPCVTQLWEKVQELFEQVAKTAGASRWSGSLELCTRTWTQEERVQLHVHLFLESGSRAMTVYSRDKLRFMDAWPFKANEFKAGRGANSSKHAGAGHYYCAAPKVGKLYWRSTHEPYVDYPINSMWISNMWQAEKITPIVAQKEYLRAKKDVVRLCSNVDAQMRMTRDMRVADSRAAVLAELEEQICEQVRIPAVDQWLEDQSRNRMRQRFLVLTGRSSTGKTMFAKSLRGREQTLELNCAGALHPDMRSFDEELHRAVVFDEASVQMVLANKKLMQAPAAEVALGSSSTNIYSYKVWVHSVLLIVCSNTWMRELGALSEEDREWLQTNSVVIQVTEPLWKQ